MAILYKKRDPMKESRKKYDPKLFYLAPQHIDHIESEAKQRNPDNDGRREQSGVVRDIIDFAIAHHPLFLSWIATRGISATDS
jgi:hypothetical protein